MGPENLVQHEIVEARSEAEEWSLAALILIVRALAKPARRARDQVAAA